MPPREALRPAAEYPFEVPAIGAGGHRTISATSYGTLP
jgi:hypothetical protein